ncbi:MAG: M56 family metallopeptidase [Acidobacteriota bacterium]
MSGWPAIDPSVVSRVASTLIQFVWQATAVAIVYGAADFAFRRGGRTSRARYTLACAALGTLLLMPVLTYARAASAEATGDVEAAAASARPAVRVAPAPTRGAGFLFAAPRIRVATAPLRRWIVSAWLGGVLALSIHLLAGFAGVARLARRRTSPARAEIARTFERLVGRIGVNPRVRLLESACARVPAALGVFRPVILFPVSALTGLEARHVEALLAHELAHVRRHDYLVNLFQAAAETLLFYHPTVWWISSRISTERENACDDAAVAATGDRRVYAAALLSLEGLRGGGRELALAADGGSLVRRVSRLFPERAGAAPADGPGAAAGLVLAAVFAAAAAAHAAAPGAPPTPDPTSTPRPAARSPRMAGAPEPPPPARAAVPPAAHRRAARAAASPAPGPDPDPVSPSEALSGDELESLESRGVTPDFLGRLSALGYTRASLNELRSLRTHGVRTEDISEYGRVFGRVTLDDCVRLRIHGATPEFVRSFVRAGYPHLSVDQALALRIHGATAEDAAVLSTGDSRPDVDAIVSARIHGVDAAFTREMRAAGFPDAGVEELTSFRIHGVTPEFVRTMRSLGFESLSSEEATGFRIHGVTTEFVRGLRALGFSNVAPEGVTDLVIHGWSLDRIREAQRQASRRLSIEELVDKGHTGRTDR